MAEQIQQPIPPNLNCAQCHGNSLVRIPRIYALTEVERQENGGALFKPASGIPVIAYMCQNCGKIVLYSAKVLREI